MRIAYFDCSAGIAGNMVLGALLDAGLDEDYLKRELGSLRLNHSTSSWCRATSRHVAASSKRGNRDSLSREACAEFAEANRGIQSQVSSYQLQINKIKRNQIFGTHFDVKLSDKDQHRSLQDILKIINQSKLSREVKKLSTRIFKRLAAAESKVHKVPINQIHFHEVGAVDAIIDIVGAAIGLEKLGIEKVYCSPIPFGRGTIKHAHGILPNPAPATTELLKGVPIYQENVRGELATPTGIAIITTITENYIDLPRMELETSGYGAGSKHYPGLTGLLAVYIGQADIPAKKDTIVQIEANIDDTNPKLYDQIIAKLMKAGALDVAITPIIMKKKRTGTSLVVMCWPYDRGRIITKIFELTTTFGVRCYVVTRETLNRHLKTVKTKYGKALVKIGSLGQKVVTIAPEYEDYKRLAEKHQIPIERAYKAVLKQVSPSKTR